MVVALLALLGVGCMQPEEARLIAVLKDAYSEYDARFEYARSLSARDDNLRSLKKDFSECGGPGKHSWLKILIAFG